MMKLNKRFWLVVSVLLLQCLITNVYAQHTKIVIPTSHTSRIYQIKFDNEGKYFYSMDDWKIIMWDFASMKQLHTFHIANRNSGEQYAGPNTTGNIEHAHISPDGTILAVSIKDEKTYKNILKIYSTVNGNLLHSVEGVNSDFTFSRDSKTLYDITRGPNDPNSPEYPGWIVRAIQISSGTIHNYLEWAFEESLWGLPLKDSQLIHFDEKSYQIFDLDAKKVVGNFVIPEAVTKDWRMDEQLSAASSLIAYPESGLFSLELHKKVEGIGILVWDIYANKEAAFIKYDGNIGPMTMQQSFHAQDLFYITETIARAKQQVIAFSRGNKTEIKKIVTNPKEEMTMAVLSPLKKTVLYVDRENSLYKWKLDNKSPEQIVARVLPTINTPFADAYTNSLHFSNELSVPLHDNGAREYVNLSNYLLDLDRGMLVAHDTMPSRPFHKIENLRLNKDSFLVSYESTATEKKQYMLYDQKANKSTPLAIKDYWDGIFPGIPGFFMLETGDVAFYTATDYSAASEDYNRLYKYNFSTKKSQKIFSARDMLYEQWETMGSLNGTMDRPATQEQVLLDKVHGLLAVAEYNDHGSIRILDIHTGQVLASHPFDYARTDSREADRSTPFIIHQIKKLDSNLVRVMANTHFFDFNLVDGSVTETKIIDQAIFDGKNNVHLFADNRLNNVMMSYEDAHGSYVQMVYGSGRINLENIQSPVRHIVFSANDSLAYTIHADQRIQVYHASSGTFYGTLYVFEGSADWVFSDVHGRFDGTDGGMQKLYFLKEREVISLDKLFERYYTPNLLRRLVAGERFAPIPDLELHGKPRVNIRYAEVHRNLEVEDDIASYVNSSGVAEIRVNAVAPEDKVDEIRLFHNGKAVNLATRGLFVSDDDGTDSKKYTINLLPGVNTFRAVALNSQRTESEPDQIIVHYNKDGKVPTPTPAPDRNTTIVDAIDRNATLHIVVVGINAYKEKINPLTYALPDATAFKAELEKDAKSVINHVNSYLIADTDASKAGILTVLDTIRKSAKPSDVFVFYYAGHGYIHPSNKEFYLVSADVTDGEESLLKNGVSAKELQTLAVDIPAQKQLFIMDACQSAGAFEKMLQHDGEQQKNLALVARSTGTHWMAASGSTETAKEFGELGHGAFTYVLLQALKGSAASNKMITVNGLKSYLQVHVPELIKKYGSAGQYPASYGFGNDFPVELLR